MNHSELVKALAKPGEAIKLEATPLQLHWLHMAVGISGEAGELLDAIEELGDLEFYMEGLRQGLGITREHTIDANIAKLTKRYGEVYSDQAAIERADKV